MFLTPLLNDSFIRQIENKYIVSNLLIDDSYCMIYVDTCLINCMYFRCMYQSKYTVCKINFYALSSDLLLDLLGNHKVLSQLVSLSHALYIGKEIYKAELSNLCSQLYTQA